jgi:hypothetical protein
LRKTDSKSSATEHFLPGVGDCDPIRAHVIDEVRSSPDRFWWASIETDFVPVHFWIANYKGRLVALVIITTMYV